MARLAIIAVAVFFYSSLGICAELATSQSIEVNASPEEVWALLVDADNWAEWNPAVKKAELKKGDGEETGSVVEFTPIIGGRSAPKVKLTLTKSDKPLTDDHGIWTHEFSASSVGIKIVFGRTITHKDGVTTVTSYETISGPGATAFKRMYGQEGLDQEHREWVEAIKKEFESPDEKGSDGK
jgi:carbon monoxide dehydrogenase subunit G